jgi:MATE family multidrug resistance protein
MFVSFYIVGTPVAVVSAFWLKIGFQGLWYGLLAAQICCACSILLITSRIDWAAECARANSKCPSSSELSKLGHKVVPILFDDEDGDEELGMLACSNTTTTTTTTKGGGFCNLGLESIVSIAEEQARLLVDGEAVNGKSSALRGSQVT